MSGRERRVEAVYRGRVQGVGFRATATTLARPLRVTGWVRNEPDGSVRLQAQGEGEEVERLLRRVEERMGSLIRERTVEEIAAVEGEEGFGIER